MPTLGELRAILDSQGKPICSSAGLTICGNCPPPTGFDPCNDELCPGQWVCGSDDFCLTITAWRDLGDADPDATVNIQMPMTFWCGFETYVIFWGSIDSDFPDPVLPLCLCGMARFMTVAVYCRLEPDGSGGFIGKDLEAFIGTGSCSPPEVACGYHVRPMAVACPTMSFGAFTADATNSNINGNACKIAFTSLAITSGRCSPSVVASNCDDTLPPFEEVPTDPDWQHACCPTRSQYRSPIAATIVGAAAGPPFTPGCDECLTGTMSFNFLSNVNFRDWLGAGVVKPGYQGAFAIGAACQGTPFEGYTHLMVIVYCHDGLDWFADAAFIAPATSMATYPDFHVQVAVQVAPCTDPDLDDYFEVVITMNPGTGCASGCPCYGGALIIADPS